MTSVVPETIATATTGLDRAPKGLLLDFGGVIILTQKRLQGRAEFAAKLQSRLQAAGIEISAEVLEGCLAAGATALTDHNIRPGARELIDYAQAQGIALGVVSNAHSGRAHRRILTELGIHDAFGVQIYSDEAGIRKPHPQMLGRAATALGVDLADCWYVGDTLDRDLVAGRRSGVGAVVLTRSQHTHEPPFPINDEPGAFNFWTMLLPVGLGVLTTIFPQAPWTPVLMVYTVVVWTVVNEDLATTGSLLAAALLLIIHTSAALASAVPLAASLPTGLWVRYAGRCAAVLDITTLIWMAVRVFTGTTIPGGVVALLLATVMIAAAVLGYDRWDKRTTTA